MRNGIQTTFIYHSSLSKLAKIQKFENTSVNKVSGKHSYTHTLLVRIQNGTIPMKENMAIGTKI